MKLEEWFKKSDKELLVTLNISNIETNKYNKKIIRIILTISIINLILNLLNMILLLKWLEKYIYQKSFYDYF